MFKKQDAFLLYGTGSDANPGVAHLYCALTNPCDQKEQVIVNVTGRYNLPNEDISCCLAPGDHEFVKKDSIVSYVHARTVTAKMYDVWKFGNQFKMKARFSDEIFIRICAGIISSDHVIPRIKNYYLANKDR